MLYDYVELNKRMRVVGRTVPSDNQGSSLKSDGRHTRNSAPLEEIPAPMDNGQVEIFNRKVKGYTR